MLILSMVTIPLPFNLRYDISPMSYIILFKKSESRKSL